MIAFGTNGESLDENDLVTSRSCIIAQSGAGKSYGVAVFCEELCRLGVGFCIIDTEGEYFTLKEGFDVLWVGLKDADLDISSVDLVKLANRVISENVPVIFDVSDVSDVSSIVNDWVIALYNAASDLKSPYLLIVEEADRFLPQHGVKIPIFYDVAKRGRKRGLGLLVASQRPALVDKDVLSQCNHQFIGKLTVKNDIDSVRYFFNSRANLLKLPDLSPGEFFMVGFKPEEVLFKFKQRVTRHESSTPLIRSRATPDKFMNFINDFKDKKTGPGVKFLISADDARVIADSKRRKLSREVVESVNLMYKPVIELSLKILRPGLFNHGGDFINSFAYFTPDFNVVDDSFTVKFDLSLLKSLPIERVKTLIAVLYERANTVDKIMLGTGLGEVDVRSSLKALLDSGYIKQSGWKGKLKVYSEAKHVVIPRVISLCSANRLSSSEPVSDSFSFDDALLKQLIKALDSKTDITDSKVLYYPFYKVVYRSGMITRELFINGVTGRLLE